MIKLRLWNSYGTLYAITSRKLFFSKTGLRRTFPHLPNNKVFGIIGTFSGIKHPGPKNHLNLPNVLLKIGPPLPCICFSSTSTVPRKATQGMRGSKESSETAEAFRFLLSLVQEAGTPIIWRSWMVFGKDLFLLTLMDSFRLS